MNPSKAEVRLSANFERNLEGIEQFVVDAGAAQAFDALPDGLLNEVIPNLEDFPAMGASFMDRQGNSVAVQLEWLCGEFIVDKTPSSACI